MALDLSRPEGRDLLQSLARASGQFITNFPADDFLSHETLSAGREDLVTLRGMGWPDVRSALDYTVNNSVGIPMLTGVGPEPVNHVLPAWDLLSGAHAAFSLPTLILHRTTTGKGGEARIPLSDVAIGTVANIGALAEVPVSGEDRPRLGNTVYGFFGKDFVTADDVRIMMVVVTPRQWKNLVKSLALEGPISALEADLGIGFATDDGIRFTHRDRLFPLFERAIGARGHAELIQALDAGGVVHSECQTLLETARDSVMVDANPIFANSTNPSGLVYPAAGAFVTIPQHRRVPPRPAPRNGQHSEEVLSKYLGIAGAKFGQLVDGGIVGLGNLNPG